MPYAAYTKVPVEQTKADIELLVTKRKARSFCMFTEHGKAIVVFEISDRRLRFDLPLPKGDDLSAKKEHRQKWRALLLCIKAKFESVESGIETFDQAFLGQIVMPDGVTVYNHVSRKIGIAYKTEKMVQLLPSPEPSTGV